MDSESLARQEIIDLSKYLLVKSKQGHTGKLINYFSGKPIKPFKWRFSQDNQSLCMLAGNLVLIDLLISHFPKDETYTYSLWEHRASHVDGNMSEIDRIQGYGGAIYMKDKWKLDWGQMVRDIEEDIEKIEEVARDNEGESMDESIITIEHDVAVGKYILEKGDVIHVLSEEEKKKWIPPWAKDKDKDEKDEKDEKKDSEKKKE